jgi:hypothetical protein
MTPDELKRIKAARTIIKVIRKGAEEKNFRELASQAETLLNLLKDFKKPRHQNDTV